MFTHVMVGTSDLERAKKFYDAALGALGIKPAAITGHRMFYRSPTGSFGVGKPIDGEPMTVANGGTISFAAATTEEVDAWHAAGAANGGTPIENPPGIRENAAGKLYLAYLRDPDGNKVCAMKRLG